MFLSNSDVPLLTLLEVNLTATDQSTTFSGSITSFILVSENN